MLVWDHTTDKCPCALDDEAVFSGVGFDCFLICFGAGNADRRKRCTVQGYSCYVGLGRFYRLVCEKISCHVSDNEPSRVFGKDPGFNFLIAGPVT